MSREDDLTIRFRQERNRLKLTQTAAGEICGVSRRAVVDWEKGVKIPAEALAALLPHGLDVAYVLTGRPENALQDLLCTPDEVELIDEYRNLPEDQKKAVRQMTQAWSLQAIQKGTSQLVRKPKKRN